MLSLGFGIGMMGNVAATSGGSGGAWTPQSPSVTLVGWYDPTDITTLFKDSAGTVPVTADGDEVFCIKSKSGIGPNLDHNSNGAGFLPIYRTGSGKPYLEFSSLRWIETTNTIQAVNATDGTNSMVVGWVPSDNTGRGDIIGFDGGNPGFQVGLYNNAGVPSSDLVGAGATTYTDTNGTFTIGTSYALVSVAKTTAIELFLNGSSDGPTAVTGPLNGTAARHMGVGSRPGSGANFAHGKFYGALIYSGALASGDQASANSYMLTKMP